MRKISAVVFAFLMVGVAMAGMALALDPNDASDALRDSDADGLTSIQEFISGSDPYNPDTDGGGCPDGWEIFYDQNRAFWDPGSENPTIHYGWEHYAQYDSDGDGVYDVNVDPSYRFSPVNRQDEFDGEMADVDTDLWSNILEYQHGTDPTNPDTDGDGWLDSGDPEPLIPDPNGPAGDGGNSGQGPSSHDPRTINSQMQNSGQGQGQLQGQIQIQGQAQGQSQGNS